MHPSDNLKNYEARKARYEREARAEREAREAHGLEEPILRPANAAETRSQNLMRPQNLAGIVGQEDAKALVRAAMDAAQRTGRPLDHMLLVGPSGTGKSTFAHAIANERNAAVYQFEAPLSHETLMDLRDCMHDGDILFLDEVHQQALGDRRGREATVQPETLYSVLEDRTLPTATGVLSFPHITMIGATTDEGRLPDAFINRFPLQPRLVRYSEDELILMVARNARVLDGRKVKRNAARMIARASRTIPREVNNLVKNCALFASELIDVDTVERVLRINHVTHDGLTADMQAMLIFLREKGERRGRQGVRYQASVNTIATAIGKSRDTKAIALRVEPWLIEQGFVQVAHGGRVLTDAGIARAEELMA